MTTIAVMQPYFVPYLGFFRLFNRADIFVAFDCVQFPRRGFVHRNKLSDRSGTLQYLTLPLQRAPRDVRINQLRFRAGANAEFQRLIRRFPAVQRVDGGDSLMAWATALEGRSVAAYLVSGLALCAQRLGVAKPIYRSSALDLPDELRGQDRVLAIAEAFGADAYVNAPGGRELYDPEVFKQRGIRLGFLDPFDGPKTSVLERLLVENNTTLRRELGERATVDWVL